MRLDLQPDGASDLLPFQACCLKALDSCEFVNTHAGVSEDGSLTWVYKGPVLEVISTVSGLRVASLNLCQQLQDEQASVACVCEYRCQGRSRLLVGVNGAPEQGTLVLLDVASSLVVKALQIPQQVTCLESVLHYGGSKVPRWALCEQLCQFYGIVAVGTEGGYIYLVDMCLDVPSMLESLQSTHASPLQLLDLRERYSANVRKEALAAGRHLAVFLGQDEQSHSNDCFHFRRPDLTAMQTFNEDEVQVTSLKYIPQSGTLAIGYNFGGFHLWKLYNPALEYTSDVDAEDLPVAFLVYQEPENDPKNFAYLWVARDDRLSEQKQESLCNVSLYQISYARKTFYASYGSFYEELNGVLLRMDHNLTVEPYNSRNNNTWSSQLLAAYAIVDPHYKPPTSLIVSDSFEEGAHSPDLSLCAFVWEAQDSRPGGVTDVFLGVFDMNRWYHAQMPSRIKCVGVLGQECCPYFAVYQLSDIVQREGYASLQDIQIKAGSLLRFINNSPMPPEQHFYPSSLAFESVCVFSNGIMSASFLGVQRQVLAHLEVSGPNCLLQPADLYHRCIQTALLPRLQETATSMSLEEHQRMALLTMVLEHGKLRFITACIRSWADGEFVHQGCTLQFLLTWAWDRVSAIKQQVDLACRPLYDWSGTPVDQRMLQVLHSCLCSLAHLRTVLHLLLTQSTPVTDQGQAELEHRIQVVTLLHHHLKLVLWFIHNGLLPEHDEAGEPSPSNYIYPASELIQVFRDRRAEMKKLNSKKTDTQQMILIDALVQSAGIAITQLWQNEGGSGQYPPPSIHVALSMFLLDNVTESTKNAVLLYLLFDMAAVAHGHQEEFAEKIALFAKAFDLPLGLVQQVHGFWLIDHMNFEDGVSQLLRQGSCQDLGSWQHRCILHALLAQGEVGPSARYLAARNPPVLTPDDVKIRLSILVASRLVSQAVAYVRYSCGPTQQEDMLKHIFLSCQQRKLLELLFDLPLTDTEERCLQTFLSENVDAASAELLVLHLLQRAQYVPAIRLNDRMRHRATMDMSTKARERTKTRNTIVEGFRRNLPATQQYLINHPNTVAKAPVTHRVEVRRPKPLSTVVTKRVETQASSQSSLIMAVMEKVAEAGEVLAHDTEEREMDMDVQSEPLRVLQKVPHSLDSEGLSVNDPGPFLCTPTMSRIRSRLGLTGPIVYPMVKTVSTPSLAASHMLSSPLSPQHTRRSKVFTADCMTLLQTPKIDHTRSRPTSPISRITTPHSILKVSRLQRSSPRARVSRSSPTDIQHKRLGFEGSVKISSIPTTPTTLSPSSTPSPTTQKPPFAEALAAKVSSAVKVSPTSKVLSAAQVSSALSTTKTASTVSSSVEKRPAAGDVSVTDVATPKHLRFASPEIQEISPFYVSPDKLARPPIRECPLGSPEGQGSQPREATIMSDEEITFNFSRNMAETMDIDEPSTLPATTPFPQVTPASVSTPSTSNPAAESNVDDQRTAAQEEKDKQPSTAGTPCSSRPGTPVARRVSHTPVSAKPSHNYVYIEESEPSDSDILDSSTSIARLHSQVQITINPEESSTDFVTETKVATQTIAEPVIEFEDYSVDNQVLTAEAMETVEPGEEEALEAIRSQLVGHTADLRSDWTEMVEISNDIDPPTPIKRDAHDVPDRDKDSNANHSTLVSRLLSRKKKHVFTFTSKFVKKQESTPPKLCKVPQSPTTSNSTEGWSDELAPGSLRIETSDDEDKNLTRKTPPVSPSRRSTRHTVDRATPERSASRKAGHTKKDSPISVHTESSSDELMPPPALSPGRSTRHATPERTHTTKAGTPERITRSMDRDLSHMEKSSVDKSYVEKGEKLKGRSRRDSSDTGIESSKLLDSAASTDTEVSASAAPKQPDQDIPKSASRHRSQTPDVSPADATDLSGVHDLLADRESLTLTRQSGRLSHTPDISASPPPSSPARNKGRGKKTNQSVDISVAVSPSRRSTRQASKDDHVPEEMQVMEIAPAPSKRSSRTSRSANTGAIADNSENVPVSPSRRSRRRSMDGATLEVSIDSPLVPTPIPASPTRRSARVSHSSEAGTSAEMSQSVPISPDRWSMQPTFVDSPDAALSASASPAHRSTRRSVDRAISADSDEASQSPSRRSTRRSVDRTTFADSAETVQSASRSPGRQSTRRSIDGTASAASSEAEPATPTRRSTRQRWKTRDMSPARFTAHLGGKSVDEDHADISQEVKDVAKTTEEVRSSRKQQKMEVVEEMKDISVATEEVRSSRQGQKDTSPRSAVKKNLMSTLEGGKGEGASFQFAMPTPLARLQTDPSVVPASEVASFVFSAPLSQTSRRDLVQVAASSGRRGKSAASLEGEPSGSGVLPAEGEMDKGAEAAQMEEEAGSSTAQVAPSKRARTSASRKKKRTYCLPSASPTNTPIRLLSFGEDDFEASNTVSERGASLPKRGSQKPKRVLRKRSVKLW